MAIPEPAKVVIFSSDPTYDHTKKVVLDIYSGKLPFNSSMSFHKKTESRPLPTSSEETGPLKLMIRPDTRVGEKETKVDALEKNFADLALMKKRSQEVSPLKKNGE